MIKPDYASNSATCPVCGGTVSGDARFCMQCGAAMPAERLCPFCRQPVRATARFCQKCGRPLALTSIAPEPQAAAPVQGRSNPPRVPSAPGRGRRGILLPLVLGAAGLAVVCVGVIVFGIATRVLAPSPAAAPEGVDAQTMQALETSVSQIESDFRAGDVNAVLGLTHPAVRSEYEPVFQKHSGELKRVADLLATRKLIGVSNGMAEYEVTENGHTFSVTFESWGALWYLSSL